jgi:oligopeptide transport system permease protein
MPENAAGASRGFWSDGWQRLRVNTGALIAASIIALVALLALLGPAVSGIRYDSLDWEHLAVSPQWGGPHLLGTDRLGRDLLVRTLYGVRISLLIGLLASAVSLLIGIAWGAIAGYRGGRTDELMMRAVDVLYSLPYLFIVIILMTLFERGSLIVLFVAIGAVGWLTIARIVRGQTLSLKQREFIEAARVSGVRGAAMIARHIVPNLLGIVIIYATLAIPTVILFEAFLSFLGLGVQSPLASLGSLVADGTSEMQSHPHLLIVPALFLAAIIYCFNYLGDGLRDALDPREH